MKAVGGVIQHDGAVCHGDGTSVFLCTWSMGLRIQSHRKERVNERRCSREVIHRRCAWQWRSLSIFVLLRNSRFFLWQRGGSIRMAGSPYYQILYGRSISFSYLHIQVCRLIYLYRTVLSHPHHILSSFSQAGRPSYTSHPKFINS